MRKQRLLRPTPSRQTLATTGGLLLAGAGLALTACGGPEATRHEADPVAVQAETSTARRLERPLEIEVFGTIEAEQTAAVSARVMAMVTAVHVRAGDPVRAGQTLIEIDPQAAQGQLAQARGALAQARAAQTLAERNYRRFEALAATAAASELELDSARMQYEQASGAVEQAEGAVQAAAAIAADTRVTAPFGGRVARRMVEVGDLAAPGRPLLLIEGESGFRLALQVPETVAAVAALAPGEPVAVAVDTRPDLGRWRAPVVEVAAGVDPLTHTLAVKVGLAAEGLASGASGRAWIGTGRRTLVAVPRTAVIERGGLELVAVVLGDGTVASRVVSSGAAVTGDGGEELVEILAGLDGDETVLLGLAAPPPAGARLEPDASAESAS